MAAALHLLIVDDQPDSLANVASHLESRGHRVEIISEPLEALRRIGAQSKTRDPFQLLLCDVNLPNLDGPGLVRELRRRGDNLPAVFVTGYHSMATRLRSELAQLKVLGILTKPVPVAEVDRFLDQVARQARGATQDYRRSTDIGQGSAERRATDGGQTSSTRRATEQGLGSGGHPLVDSGMSGGGIPEKEPFYGTSRTFRARFPTPAPTEGILAKVERPAAGPDIIPDEVFTGRYNSGGGSGNRPATGTPPVPPQRTPPIPFGRPPTEEFPAGEAKEASGFYPTSAPLSEPLSGTQKRPGLGGELPSKHGPLTGFRDPVTGEIRRPSGIFTAEPSPMDPAARADTTGRIHRGGTGRIERVSGFPPANQPPADQQPLGGPARVAGGDSGTRRSGTWSFPTEPAAPPTHPPGQGSGRRQLNEPPGASTTSRFRRSVGNPPAAEAPPAGGAGNYLNPGTSRIRRSISQAPQQVPPLAPPGTGPDRPSCTVACAHCQGEFTVAIKPESYTVICVHCGKLNRIDPL